MAHTLSWSHHVDCVVQVTFEAPPGLKRNLQRTYAAWGPEVLAAGTPLRAQLLFLLAWFHGIVQERRSFVPQVSSLPPPAATHSAHLPQAFCPCMFITRAYGLRLQPCCLSRLVTHSPAATRSYNRRRKGLVACAWPQPCHCSGCLPIGLVQAL